MESQVERLSKLIESPPEELGTICSHAAASAVGSAAGGSSAAGSTASPAAGGGAGASGNLRLDIINSTVNINARLTRLYDLLENDILSRISSGQHYIAPYKVRGPTLFLCPVAEHPQRCCSDRPTVIACVSGPAHLDRLHPGHACRRVFSLFAHTGGILRAVSGVAELCARCCISSKVQGF